MRPDHQCLVIRGIRRALLIQRAIHCHILFVGFTAVDHCEVFASVKGVGCDVLHAGSHSVFRNICVSKSTLANLHQLCKHGNLSDIVAAVEGVAIDALYLRCLRQGNCGQCPAIVERIVADLFHRIRQHDILQCGAPVECALVHAGQLRFLTQNHIRQRCAVLKRIEIETHHRIRNGNLLQAIASAEGLPSDGADRVTLRKSYLCQFFGIPEAGISQNRDLLRNFICTASATGILDQGSAIDVAQHAIQFRIGCIAGRHMNILKVLTAAQGILTYIPDPGRDGNFRNAAALKGTVGQFQGSISLRNLHGGQAGHILKCLRSHRVQGGRQMYAGQRGTRKCLRANRFQIACLADGKARQAALLECAVANLRHRIGEYQRNRSIAGEGVVIDDTQDRIFPNGYIRGSFREGILADFFYRSRNGHGGQSITVEEGIVANFYDILTQGYAGQCIVIIEAPCTDPGHRIAIQSVNAQLTGSALVGGQGNGAIVSDRILPFFSDHIIHSPQEISGNALVPIHLNVGRKLVGSEEHADFISTIESGLTDVIHRLRQIYPIQPGTAVERITANVSNRIGNVDLFQSGAAIESIVIHIGDLRIAEIDASQIVRTIKGTSLNTGQRAAFSEYNRLHTGALEQVSRNVCQSAVFLKGDFLQIITVVEHILSHLFYGGGNDDFFEAAVHKGIDTQAMELASGGEGHVCHRIAILKSLSSNVCYIGRNFDTCQTVAGIERVHLNIFQTLGQNHRSQIFIIIEGIGSGNFHCLRQCIAARPGGGDTIYRGNILVEQHIVHRSIDRVSLVHGELRQQVAGTEGASSDVGHFVIDFHLLQAAESVGKLSDGCNTCGQLHRRKGSTGIEAVFAHNGQIAAFSKVQNTQRLIIAEGIVAQLYDTV